MTDRSKALALIVAFVAVVFAVRLAGPPNLMDQDQERPAAYILDVVRNGNWIVQRDETGDVTSKPPLYTWLAATTATLQGRLTGFSLYLPCAASVAAVSILLLLFGTREFGFNTGLIASAAFLLSMPALKMVALARTDPLFTLTVTLTAYAAYDAWKRGRNWIWFWFAATAATLTKGPLGLVLGATGLLAAFWENDRPRFPMLLRNHWRGILLYLGIGAGWLLLALWAEGPDVWKKMIGKELVGQVVEGNKPDSGAGRIYLPTFYFITRYLPWSLPTLLALWRILRHWKSESTHPLERFLVIQLLSGILIFSFAGHKRPDLLFPLLPAAALLTGRDLALRLPNLQPLRLVHWFALASTLTATFAAGYYWNLVLRDKLTSEKVADTISMREFAKSITDRVGPDFPLTYVRSPYALQYYLNTMRRRIPVEQAFEALRLPEAVFLVLKGDTRLEDYARTGLPQVHTVAKWPETGEPVVKIVSNYPRLETPARMATYIWPFQVRMDGARLVDAKRGRMTFEPVAPAPTVYVTNQTSTPASLHLRLNVPGAPMEKSGTIGPRETWKLEGKDSALQK
ncbi:MAG: glycosyltransferase family 39 protein [Candidatus Sumerlaeaceae bacterium]|nr:glycosyltransferase family 39 protein [Candidatus Sumerlaeaceae bacterium]